MLTHDLDTPDKEMTLVERLLNPVYVTNPSGGEALLDKEATLATMKAAADAIRDLIYRGVSNA